MNGNEVVDIETSTKTNTKKMISIQWNEPDTIRQLVLLMIDATIDFMEATVLVTKDTTDPYKITGLWTQSMTKMVKVAKEEEEFTTVMVI